MISMSIASGSLIHPHAMKQNNMKQNNMKQNNMKQNNMAIIFSQKIDTGRIRTYAGEAQ